MRSVEPFRYRVKIFGERHTATNALKRLVETNSRSRCLPSTSSELEGLRLRARLGELAGKGLSIEAAIDALFSQWPDQFSWKHCATRFEDVSVFRELSVLILVRHPASWLSSLYLEPYHLPRRARSLEEFLSRPVQTRGRERLDERVLTPAEIYNEKVRSYLEFSDRLAAAGGCCRIMRFEDVVGSQEALLRSLKPMLDDPAEELQEVTRSTKNAGVTLSDYREFYRSEKWRGRLAGREQAIDAAIDWTLFERFGYRALSRGLPAVVGDLWEMDAQPRSTSEGRGRARRSATLISNKSSAEM